MESLSVSSNNIWMTTSFLKRCSQPTESIILLRRHWSKYNQIFSLHGFICMYVAGLVLLDLGEAVDTIDHNIMLRRLQNTLGVQGNALRGFSSCPTGRKQSVTVNRAASESTALAFGVPQGSVLGPILFTCYSIPLGSIIKGRGFRKHFYNNIIK